MFIKFFIFQLKSASVWKKLKRINCVTCCLFVTAHNRHRRYFFNALKTAKISLFEPFAGSNPTLNSMGRYFERVTPQRVYRFLMDQNNVVAVSAVYDCASAVFR